MNLAWPNGVVRPRGRCCLTTPCKTQGLNDADVLCLWSCTGRWARLVALCFHAWLQELEYARGFLTPWRLPQLGWLEALGAG